MAIIQGPSFGLLFMMETILMQTTSTVFFCLKGPWTLGNDLQWSMWFSKWMRKCHFSSKGFQGLEEGSIVLVQKEIYGVACMKQNKSCRNSVLCVKLVIDIFFLFSLDFLHDSRVCPHLPWANHDSLWIYEFD